ncbi:MAG: DUF4287 domain-containing protein, partial [Gemmatimonadales bacterium]
MADANKALETMLANIEAKTGTTLAQLGAELAGTGLAKHGELRSWLMERYGLGHGQANTVVHLALKSDGESAARASGAGPDAVLDEIYSGKKADLRPVHDRILAILAELGPFEAAPKKGYVSYRRKKQFVMVGPKTNTAVELGLGAKTLPADTR